MYGVKRYKIRIAALLYVFHEIFHNTSHFHKTKKVKNVLSLLAQNTEGGGGGFKVVHTGTILAPCIRFEYSNCL